MFVIEKLPTEDVARQHVIQAVADIEAVVQPHDNWTYQTIISLLEQDSVELLVVYEKEHDALIDMTLSEAFIDNTVANNKVIGYCLYQVIFEQAEILRIGTHSHNQRQGIASQLFDRLNNELKRSEVESLLLEVRADNVAAIALYEQQDFIVIHTRKGYYQFSDKPAIDALIMQRVYF